MTPVTLGKTTEIRNVKSVPFNVDGMRPSREPGHLYAMPGGAPTVLAMVLLWLRSIFIARWFCLHCILNLSPLPPGSALIASCPRSGDMVALRWVDNGTVLLRDGSVLAA